MSLPTKDGCCLGIDASSYQGLLDWPTLADAGVRFAILKATEGLNCTDKDFITNALSAKNEPRIKALLAYHFLTSGSDPIAQAQAFFNEAGRYTTTRPVVDFEGPALAGVTVPQAYARLITCLDSVAEQYACVPILYSAPTYIAAISVVPGALAKLATYDLWLAQYTTSPKVPKPWTSAIMWQFSGGSMKMPNGVPVDLNWFYGSEDDLSVRLSRPGVE